MHVCTIEIMYFKRTLSYDILMVAHSHIVPQRSLGSRKETIGVEWDGLGKMHLTWDLISPVTSTGIDKCLEFSSEIILSKRLKLLQLTGFCHLTVQHKLSNIVIYSRVTLANTYNALLTHKPLVWDGKIVETIILSTPSPNTPLILSSTI